VYPMCRKEGGVSSDLLAEEHRIKRMNTRRVFVGTILVLVGLLILLSYMGVLPWYFWIRFIQLWPVLLIVFGLRIIFRKGPLALLPGLLLILVVIFAAVSPHGFGVFKANRITGTSTQVLESDIREAIFSCNIGTASVKVDSINISSPANVNNSLYHIEYSLLTDRQLVIDYMAFGNRAYVDFDSAQKSGSVGQLFAGEKGSNVDIWLYSGVEWELTFNIGTSRFDVDLSKLSVKKLDINSGVSDITVKLGNVLEHSEVVVDSGVSNIKLSVPSGVGVRVIADASLSRTNLRKLNFEQRDGVYFSPGYNSAERTIDIYFSAGVSQFTLKWDS
jgi:hypothetical protein